MNAVLGVSANYILIDLSVALIGMVAGFFCALWYAKFKQASAGSSREPSAQEQALQANEIERTNMAAMQLRDLAQNMVVDVGDHCDLVGRITDQLGNIPGSSQQDTSTAVAAAISEIVGANEKLQKQLHEAENKIQSQAEEIRTKMSEARTDALTQLPNRRAFDDKLSECFDQYKKSNRPSSLILFDVDHFKRFNDTHGHQAGDEVLRSIGKTLKETVSSTDMPFRYGGEEFGLVMPGSNAKNARIAAERVRKVIEEMIVDYEGEKLNVHASIGVAEIGEGNGPVQLVRRSDEAVYASKQAGRNCGHWHDGNQCLLLDQDAPAESTQVVAEEKVLAETKAPAPAPSSATPPTQAQEPQKSVYDLLPEKSAFSEELQRRVSESQRFGVSLSVLNIQIRDYKNLENEFGNAVGHILLNSTTQLIKSSLRDMDLVGKMEPGFFVIMLPGNADEEAYFVGKRIREKVKACAIPLGNKKIRLDVQYGAADVQPEDTSETIIDRARQLLEMGMDFDSKGVLTSG